MPRQTPESEDPEKQANNRSEQRTEDGNQEQVKSAASASAGDGLSSLRRSHRDVIGLLDTINKKTPGRQTETIQQLRTRWLQHSQVEEEFLLPELERRGVESAELLEGEVKRDLVKLLFANLRADRTDSAEDAARLRVLDTFIRQLVEAEEKPETGLFARVQSYNLSDLGEKLSKRQQELDENGPSDPVLNHLSFDDFIPHAYEKEANMTNRERDSQGRFMSEDDRRYGSRRRDDEDRYSRGSRPDDRRYGRRDDDGYSRDRGQGGWFGDSEGHAEAARRGWDERRPYDRGRYDDDDRRGRSYGRSRDDDGYSRDRGQGGWFGDSEGHAEAARRGWDERRPYDRDRYDDDDRRGRYASSSRRDDDDRRYGRRDDDGYSRDRGQGGWFGDPEGHADAARKGWRHRDDY